MRAFTRNSASRLLAQSAGKLALFLWTLVLAQKLTPAGYGLYAWLLSVVTVLGILSDYGLGFLATGDVARRPEQAGRYLTHTLVLRMALAGIAYAALAALTAAEPSLREIAGPALILGLSIFTVSAVNGANAILNAREELQWSSLLSGLIPVLTLGAGWAMLAARPGLLAATLPSPLAGAIVLLAAVVLFRWKRIHAEGPVEPRELGRVLREGAPFLLLSLLGTLNVALDTLLIKPLAGEAAAGLYSASQKLILALMVLPVAVCDSAYPVWSREAGQVAPSRDGGTASAGDGGNASAPDGGGATSSLPLRRILGLLLGAGALAGAILAALASPLVRLLYGEAYAGAAVVLRVHALTLAFMFLNSPLAIRLLSRRRLRALALAQAAIVALHAALVLALLPRAGLTGVAAATAISEGVSLVLLAALLAGGRAGGRASGGRSRTDASQRNDAR